MDVKGIIRGMWQIGDALLKGNLAQRLYLQNYFVHIIYTFVLAFVLIIYGLAVENTLAKVEKSKTLLNDMKIYHAQKTVELVKTGRLVNIEKTLEDLGSDVRMPEKPACRVER